jgi:hypothetical protein
MEMYEYIIAMFGIMVMIAGVFMTLEKFLKKDSTTTRTYTKQGSPLVKEFMMVVIGMIILMAVVG